MLYLSSDDTNQLHFLTYPGGQRVGRVSKLAGPGALCSDQAGNVWVALYESPSGSAMAEYPHGGKTPIATLQLYGQHGLNSCSVDPVTGDLAVMYEADEIAVYPRGTGNPITYTDFYAGLIYSLTHDNKGDLFAYGSGSGTRILAELPYGGSSFTNMEINADIEILTFAQWDGAYIAVGATSTPFKTTKETIYRLAVSGSKVTVVGTLTLQPNAKNGFGRYAWIRGGTLIQPDLSGHVVNFYAYPKGGEPIKTIDPHLKKALGLTVSVAK